MKREQQKGTKSHATIRSVAAKLFICLAITAYASQAAADGMAMEPITTATEHGVRATAQRALLWLRNGVWEIHINPIFERKHGEAAWVVPFPALPEVSESSHDLFDDLEITTSPVFIHYCTPPSSGHGGADGGSGSGGDVSDVETSVTVWDRGEIGDMEYVVLSSDQGDDLVFWLHENGFALPEKAAELIAEFETEGQYFFVGRIGKRVSPSKPISPVRFVLPEMQPPLYPLRLTGTGVQGNERLSLTLWVVFPSSRHPETNEPALFFVPESHAFAGLQDIPSSNPTDADSYHRIVDDFFQEHPYDRLFLHYGESMSESLPATGYRCHLGYPYMCVYGSDLGISWNRQWSPEISEMSGEKNFLLRFEGSLDTTALERDFVLKGVEWNYHNTHRLRTDTVFSIDQGTCNSGDSEQPAEMDTSSVSPVYFCGCSLINKPGSVLRILLLLMVALLFIRILKIRKPRIS